MTETSGVPELPPGLLSEGVRRVMVRLRERDAADRADGSQQAVRLRAIAPDVGVLLATLVLAIRARTIVEVGTSGGYSTLWLASAAASTGGRVTTFEVDPAKVRLARTTFADAGVEDLVDLRSADGVAGLAAFSGSADLVFIDSEKRDYLRMLDAAVGALRPAGLLVADNLTSHAAELAAFRAAALADPRLVGLVVPIGGGELVAVRR